MFSFWFSVVWHQTANLNQQFENKKKFLSFENIEFLYNLLSISEKSLLLI